MMLELRKIDNQEVNEQLFFSFVKANPNIGLEKFSQEQKRTK